MNKKGKRRLPKTFMESEVGALIEYFDTKLDLLLELLAAMNEKMDQFKEEAKSRSNRMTESANAVALSGRRPRRTPVFA